MGISQEDAHKGATADDRAEATRDACTARAHVCALIN